MFVGRTWRAIGLLASATCAACAEGIPGLSDASPSVASELDAGDDEPTEPDDEQDAEPAEITLPSFEAGARDASTSFDASARDAALMPSGEGSVDAADVSDAASDADLSDAGPAYVCPGCTLKVQWNTSTVAAMSQSIAGYLKLLNTGAQPIALASVTVRYWLREPMSESMVVECYHWDDGKGANLCARATGSPANSYGNLNARVVAGIGELRYIELSFLAGAGQLPVGAGGPGAAQLAFHLPNYTAQTQTDDPSFDPLLSAAATSMLFDAPKITAYVAGTLAWGSEP